jgi:hypothetical protein
MRPAELIRGDVLFLSREDNLLSQTIRFWTQSPFNHTAIVARPNTIVETYPNKGILSHSVDEYVGKLSAEHQFVPEKPFAIWVVRLAQLPPNFELNLETVAWDDYDSESVLENIIHAGNSDGPDHPIPFPWLSEQLKKDQTHMRLAKPWETRRSYSCAELIARLYDLDPYETYQWLPHTLFVKMLSFPGSRIFKVDVEQAPRPTGKDASDWHEAACKDKESTLSDALRA